jgi:hypothetical protein
MNYPGDQFLMLTGNIAGASTYPAYARMFGLKGKEADYVEFLSAEARGAQLPLSAWVNKQVDVYIGINDLLFFSDDAAPADPGQPQLNPVLHGPAAPALPVGMVGIDGVPVTITKAGNAIVELSVTDKDNTSYAMQLASGSASAPGRLAKSEATWVYSKANFTVNGGSQLQLAVSFSPSNLLLQLSASYGFGEFGPTLQTILMVDLAPAVSAAGNAVLTRKILYHGASFANQVLDMPASAAGATLTLPASVVRSGLGPVWFFSPALAAVVSGLAQAAQAAPPLVALGSPDPGGNEPQAAFVAQALQQAGPALAPLSKMLSSSLDLGFSDTFTLLGWNLGEGAGQAALSSAYASLWTNYRAWARASGGGSNFIGYRKILSDNPFETFDEQAADAARGKQRRARVV